MASAVAGVSGQRRGRPWFLQQNLLTAVIGGVVGFVLVQWVLGGDGGFLQGIGWEINQIMLAAYFVGIFGFFLGLGYLNYPIAWLLGRELSEESQLRAYGAGGGVGRYFRLTLDHKVIGIQYLIAILAFFCIAGFDAMLIRTELLTPDANAFSPETYLTLVAEHSVGMLIVASSVIIGPFGNYFIPLMIGARRMAYPRIEALSFWTFLLALIVLPTAFFFGGIPTGWTGYAPLSVQAHGGQNAYIITWALAGTSMTVSGINIIATVLLMRAPGMTWSRVNMTVWAVVVGSILAWLAAPIMVAVQLMVGFDRAFLTGLFVPIQGGSAFLYENIFWTFGHPEVYILAVPAMGIVLDILPVFSRRPIYVQRAAVVSMFSIALLSWFVWQHHLFVSGLTPGLRPFFMFSTEMISFPTGFIFLAGLGTLFSGRIRFNTAMLFALAWFPNFLLGGTSGVFLSDVPADIQLHGSYFVQAHFHFVLMGGTFFAFFAAVYYWLPKMTGRLMNETLGQIHFWTMWIGFNGTFITLMINGMLGMPRRYVTYFPYLHTTNVIATLFAYLLGASMLPFLANLIYSWQFGRRSVENPWRARSLEWQTATPIPLDNFEEVPLIVAGPYEYGKENVQPVAILKPSEQRASGVASAGN